PQDHVCFGVFPLAEEVLSLTACQYGTAASISARDQRQIRQSSSPSEGHLPRLVSIMEGIRLQTKSAAFVNSNIVPGPKRSMKSYGSAFANPVSASATPIRSKFARGPPRMYTVCRKRTQPPLRGTPNAKPPAGTARNCQRNPQQWKSTTSGPR